MTTEVIKQGQNPYGQTAVHKYKQSQARLQSEVHQYKKSLLETKSELQFQKNRATQFEEKYKTAIRYQNEEKQLKKIMNQLNQKLKLKQNQILQLLKGQQQKKRKISQLQSSIEELENNNEQFEDKLKQIQSGAVSAIIEKQNVIAQLQQKLHQIELNQSTSNSNLNLTILELQEKYKQVQDRFQATKIDLQSIIEQKQQEVRELLQKSQHQKQKLQERISRLEQQIQDYQKHIEHLNEQRNQQENLQEKYYLIQQKLRKSQKRTAQLENLLSDVKKEYEQSLTKFTNQQEENKNLHQEIKSFKLKIKEQQSDVKDKQKANNELKIQHEKAINELNKKYSHLQTEKKKINENIQIKNIELERLKIEIDEKITQINQFKNLKSIESPDKTNTQSRVSLAAQIKTISIQQPAHQINPQSFRSPVKMMKKQSEDQSRLIDKYKNQINDLEQNNVLLNSKLTQKIKQIQQLRQRLVAESGSASRSSEQQKLLRTIEDLNTHVRKVENSLMINKLKYAQDESYWSTRQKNHRVELQNCMKQFKKQKSELLQRIDRMKKTVGGKDKKMDYYQSGFK